MTTDTAKHTEQTVHIKTAYLDDLLSLTGELIINNERLNQVQSDLEDRFAQKRNVDRMALAMVQTASINAFKIGDHMQNLVMQMRMVPIAQLFNRFPRVVRDLAKQTQKNVALEIVGEDTQVDRTIIEKMADPIVHQLRNCVDHGIEPPAERATALKPEQGVVTLRAFIEEQDLHIQIADDGRGIDAEKIRRKAVEKGLVSEEASRAMERDAILDFIYQPGFSTAATVTDTSGRGVGMDVVRTTVNELGGAVKLTTELGKGTTVDFRIPMVSAVNITEALVVRAAGELIAIPLSAVVAILNKRDNELTHILRESEVLHYRGRSITLVSMAAVLGFTKTVGAESTAASCIVIVGDHRNKLAMKVEEVLQPQKVVATPFNEYFQSHPGLAGTTILSGEQVGLILNVPGLLADFYGLDETAPAAAAQPVASDAPAVQSAANDELSFIDNLLTGDTQAAPGVNETLDAAQLAAIAELQGKKPAAKTASSGNALQPQPALLCELPEMIGETDRGKSKADMDEQTAADFLREIKTHLEHLNSDLLQLERAPHDESCVNTVFRAFHSIKGAVNMMGYHDVGYLTHAAESALDDARKGEIKVTGELIDMLLGTVDELQKYVGAIESSGFAEVRSPELMLKIANHRNRAHERLERKAAEVLDADYPIGSFNDLLEWGLRSRGLACYEVLIRMGMDKKNNTSLALLALKELFAHGVIARLAPAVEEIQQGRFGDAVKVLLASRLPEPQLAKGLQEFKRHHGFQEVRLLPAQSAAQRSPVPGGVS